MGSVVGARYDMVWLAQLSFCGKGGFLFGVGRSELPRGLRLIRYGMIGLVCGTGPLLIAIAVAHMHGDQNPNPIGPGMLAGLTFPPSLFCLLAGLIRFWRNQ